MFLQSTNALVIILLNSTVIIVNCLSFNYEFKPEKCHLIPNDDQLIFASYNDSIAGLKQTRLHERDSYRKRQRNSNENFKIHTHYHQSFFKLPTETYNLYKNRLIPNAIDFWQSSLKVKYSYSPILLGRSCSSSQTYQSANLKVTSCENNCMKATKCGDYIQIPDEHLEVCRVCTSTNNCKDNGTRSSGVLADFILYISSIHTEHCDISNTIAFASYCQLESKYNRPVAGYVNICPQSISTKQSDVHSALATLKHEILHALGFSAGLYAFFIDSNGRPLTQRDSNTGKPPYNKQIQMYEPSDRVVKVFTRKNWKISDGYTSRNVTLIVTPRVVQEVRSHFNCSELEGGELEDQGEVGTKYTHWEKRIFENEAMTGTYTQNSIFSRMTFAFLEDTGWYTVNYSYAEDLKWGKNLGCDFAMKSCKNWIDDRQASGASIRPYCNNLPQQIDSHAKYECNTNRDAVLLCNLMKYTMPIPRGYRNFDSKSVSTNQSQYIGGSVILADYCPFMQQVSWSVNNEIIRDSKCIYEENRPDTLKNYVLEEYGEESRCFLHNKTWQIYSDSCQSRTTVSKTVGCYNYVCNEQVGLVIRVSNNEYVCEYKDQIIEIVLSNSKQSVYFGNIICPSCEELCQDKIQCPVKDPASQLFNEKAHKKRSQISKYATFTSQHDYCLDQLSKSTNLNSKIISIFLCLVSTIFFKNAISI